MAAINMKDVLNGAILGTGVVIITPWLTPGIIPEFANLGVITVGQILSAGLAVLGVSYLLDQFMK